MGKNFLLMIIALLAATVAAFGQGSVGTLNGTVLDPAGAVVAGASVVATNADTAVESKTTTTSAGVYTLPYLPQGRYTIRASAPGFRTSTAENVILRVAQTMTVNVRLEMGQVTEQVTVSDTPPLLESDSAEIGRYISVEEYKSWPILVDDGQRQIQSFIFTSLPGTTGGTFQGSINGGQQYSHEILVDGIAVGRSDLSGGNNNEFSPSAEAVSEFKLQTGTVGAQYNGGQTAVANFSIKSGTNELHGSAFAYIQNEALNARDLSTKTQGLPKSKYRQDNWGYSLGGPVYIPKIYNGKNKTFFFTNFEKDHLNQLIMSGFTTVAPTEYKKGDFSKLLDPNWTLNPASGTNIGTDGLGRPVVFGQIYDPLTTRTLSDGSIVRDAFPGNIIPENRWDPVAKNIIGKVGLADPTWDKMIRNIGQVGTCCPFFDLNILGIKADHNISDRHHFSAFYNQSYRKRNNNGGSRYLPVPGAPTSSWQDQITPGRMVRASLNSTLFPTIINRVALGFNRFLNQNGAPLDTLNQGWAEKIGIQNTAGTYFPQMNFGGREYQGGSIGQIGVGWWGAGANGSYVINDDVTWIRGKHSFHFGYQFTRYYYNTRNVPSAGSFSFSPRSTDLPGYINQTGHSFASFLLGAVNSASRYIPGLSSGFRQPQHALYAMDDIKLTPKLTVNVGLRWEIIPPFYERTGRMSYIDLNAPNPAADNRPGTLVFKNRASSTYWREFGPRLGFAYQATNKLVVRAGYAILNTPPIRNDWGYDGFVYGYDGNARVRQGTSPTGYIDDPAIYLSQRYPDFTGKLPDTNPADSNWNAYQTTAPDANRPGYTQNWNLTIQYQLPRATVLEVAYVGNKGTRLWGAWPYAERNALPAKLLALGDILRDPVSAHPQYKPFASFPDEFTVAQALRPYPQFFGIAEAYPYGANSSYNSLQITVTKHLTTGLAFLAAYTWSKTLTTVDSNGPGAYYATIQDYFNRGLERSIASFNYPQNFKLTWVYETPVGKGRRFDLGWANYIVGGWQLSAIHNYRSGDPIAVGQAGINSPDGFSGGIRPDVTGQPYTLRGAPSKADYFNPTQYLSPAAFAPVPLTGNGVPLRVGTAPRYISGLRGPYSLGETFRMAKKFPLYRERAKFGIGMTMTNPFNRTGPYVVSTTVGDSGFGQLLQGGGGRTLQLDARMEW